MSVTATHELKGLQTRLKQAEVDLEQAVQASKSSVQKEATARNAVRTLRNKIEQLQKSTSEPVVTEHAMLRYLERVHGLDLENIRQAILDESTTKHIKFARSGKIKRDDGTIVFQNNVVVTFE
jgi:hypothetical protein